MRKYEVTLKDETTYIIDAGSEKEAKDKALDYWDYRIPSIIIKEKKKIKKTIHYSVQKYYKQDVLADNDMSEDEIIDLWKTDDIKILTNPKPDDDGIYNDEEGAWVE